jgi:hypothetical protein
MDTQGDLKLTKLLLHYTDSELREMIHFIYRDSWSKNALGFMERKELEKLVLTDYQVLLWTMHQFEQQITATPNYSQSEVDAFFKRTQNELHYLASKPVEDWDDYDRSNYRSLMVKTGTTKKVYAIFTSDVLAEDVYAVTTQPSYFFDTKEEAEVEIENIIAKGEFKSDELVIHSLWRLT